MTEPIAPSTLTAGPASAVTAALSSLTGPTASFDAAETEDVRLPDDDADRDPTEGDR